MASPICARSSNERARLNADLADRPDTLALIASFDDAALAALMTNLGGHCIETLLDAFARAQDDVPTLFIAYTVKGYGLPLAGHKDNHAGLMNPGQVGQLRDSLGIAPGDEWTPFAGVGDNVAAEMRDFLARSPLAAPHRPAPAAPVPVPTTLPVPDGDTLSTQAAFGRILLDLADQLGPAPDGLDHGVLPGRLRPGPARGGRSRHPRPGSSPWRPRRAAPSARSRSRA